MKNHVGNTEYGVSRGVTEHGVSRGVNFRIALLVMALLGAVNQAFALGGETVIAQKQLTAGDTLTVDLSTGSPELKFEICGAFSKVRSAKEGKLKVVFLDENGEVVESASVLRSAKLMGEEDTKLTVDERVVAESETVMAEGETVVAENYSHTDGIFALCFAFQRDLTCELLAGVDDYLHVRQTSVASLPRKAKITATESFMVYAVNLDFGVAVYDRCAWPYPDRKPEEMEGNSVVVYNYLDNEVNNTRVLRGGDYSLALIANGTGGYSLYYLSGAVQRRDAWRPGMAKGELNPTIFENHYDLSWRDADFATDFDGAWAELLENGAILVLHFPREEAVLRFFRQ